MSSIEGHLREIGTKLWDRGGNPGSGHAAIMVGAGFSRNAQPLTRVAGKFPDWENLARHFVDKLYPPCVGCTCDILADGRPGCSTWKKRQRHLWGARETSGALRLAEMFEAVHGRSALEQVLAAAIPDSHHQPGLLHQKLVRLPWSDIFTTNWDTLLERAVDLYDRSYSVIHAPIQIATRRAPRIVKLHGTLNVGTRLIFTEQDFLSYNDEFAPFVSLVQQSMMENVFVLVGFSGEDPNFLHWSSWVRRQLGRYIQRVYLIDIHEVDESQRRLMAARRVTPLNISSLIPSGAGNDDHERALSAFFDRLLEARYVVRANLRWPARRLDGAVAGPSRRSPTNRSPDDPPIAERIATWEQRIGEAPRWLSLPRRNRRVLESYLAPRGEFEDVLSFVAARFSEIDPTSSPVDQQKDDEWRQKREREERRRKSWLTWRARAARLLLHLHLLSQSPPDQRLIDALSRFFCDACGIRLDDGAEPLPTLCASGPVSPIQETLVSLSIGDILLVLLRHGRLTNDATLFNWASTVLSTFSDEIDIRCGFAQEVALWYLQHSDPAGAAQAASGLSPHASRPRWGLRKAALLAELEQNDEARILLKETVDRVRQLRFEADQPHESIWQQSREAWAFYAYRALTFQDLNALDERRRRIEPNRLPIAEELEELGDRLSELGANLNDPRPEIAALEAELLEAAYEVRLRPLEPDAVASDSSQPALAYLLLMETVGLSPRTARHNRICPSTPLAVTAAATLWTTHHPLAWGLLLRSASSLDLDRKPLAICKLVEQLSDQEALNLLTDLDRRSHNLIEGLDHPDVSAAYCEGRLSTIATLIRMLASNRSAPCVLAGFLIACKWHDRPALVRVSGAFGEIRRLFFDLMSSNNFPWDQALPRLFALSHSVRADECWGRSRWPDPFEILVGRMQEAHGASLEEDAISRRWSYKLSPRGEAVATRYGRRIAKETEFREGALSAARQALAEPEIAHVIRRLALINVASASDQKESKPRKSRRRR